MVVERNRIIMKAILISDHAKWCAKMMNGDKKIEVRKGTALYKAIKKLIDQYGYADLFVYCTKEEYLTCDLYTGKARYHNIPKGKNGFTLSGKVPFKFRCYNVEHFEREYLSRYIDDYYYDNGEPLNKKFYKNTCLTEKELFDYIGGGEGCAIHISDLEIFDKPKELSEFKPYRDEKKVRYMLNKGATFKYRVFKAPQSFMFIEVE